MALSFAFGGNTGETPESIARKRKIANALLASNTMPQNVGQGIAAIGDALAGRYMTSKLDAQDKAGQAEVGSILEAPAFPSSVAAGGSPFSSEATGVEGPEAYRNAIASIESAGSGDYGAVGPTHPKMGPALGRYQIMEANLAPWGQEALGRPVSKEEFLANPKIQDAIFDAKFGGYVKQFGPSGAAQAWFAGPGGVGKTDRKDSLGTSVGVYADKFNRALGRAGNAPPVQTASLDPSAGMADFGDHGPVTELPPEVRAQRLAANQAGMANVTDAGIPRRVSPDIMAALQPPTQPGNVIQVPPREDVAGPAPQQPQPAPMDWTDVPQLSAAAGVPFDNSRVPGSYTTPAVAAALAQPQSAPQPQSSISDALLRKNDMALGGIMAPAGTPQPVNARLGGAFPDAPSPDRAPIPAGGGGFFPPAPSAAPASGGQDEAARMLKVINHPYATDAQKQYAMRRLAVLEKQNDPDTQIDRQIKTAQLAALNKKDTTAEYKEVNKRLYRIDKNTNEVTDVTPEAPGGTGGKFRFDGTSTEGQALNGLMDSGVLTEQQAQEIAAGKTITDPSTGAITFLTPSGIVTQMPGQAPQPLTPAPSGAPAAAPAGAPTGTPPSAAPTAAPQGGPKEINEKNYPGMIQLTDGKKVPLVEAVRRNRQLYSVVKPELGTVEKNFASLTDPKNQVGNILPGGNYITSDAYQQAHNSLQAIIASYLYSTSGATANPGEVKNQADMLMPSPGEKSGSLAAKKRRIRTMVNAIAIGGDLPPEPDEEDNLPLEELLKKYGG